MTTTETRALQTLRGLAPKYPSRRRTLRDVLLRHDEASCCYCGRYASQRRLAVNPISLRRAYHMLCARPECSERLVEWSGHADARRRRAQFDWEAENPTIAAAVLVGHIPPQYPSVSRATLRAFLDSGMEDATVDGTVGVESLNGSIRVLGFAAVVYAEQRSGETVLRRVRSE